MENKTPLEIYKETIDIIIDCTKMHSIMYGIKHENSEAIINTFVSKVYGFDSYYIFMPTRVKQFTDDLYSNKLYRDFVLELTEKIYFRLIHLKGMKFITKLTEDIVNTANCTKIINTLCPVEFSETVYFDTDYAFETIEKCPSLLVFYFLSQNFQYISSK